VVEKGFTGGGRQCWGLVLKYYELRTRQHKILNVNALRPSKHYFPQDKLIKDVPSSLQYKLIKEEAYEI
jgi:hypothetical protein